MIRFLPNFPALIFQALIQEKLEPGAFVGGIFIPMLKREKLAELQDQMKHRDKTLLEWVPHLNAACRYLATNGLISVLYRMQVAKWIGAL